MPLKHFNRYMVMSISILSILLAAKYYHSPPYIPHPALATHAKKNVWAWQRPEDLRFLPSNVGVAYVATSVNLENNQAYVYPRMHPLLVNPNTRIIPVVHVDASWRKPPTLNDAQAQAIVDALVHAATLGNSNANSNTVQLDFEVRRSQQKFLNLVVTKARQSLPKTTALSMTALASWCAGDDWLGKMPADEIVPMAFRMAAGDVAIRQLLAKRGHFKPENCQTAIGTALDEPIVILDSTNIRRYYFSPKPWTHALWQQQNARN